MKRRRKERTILHQKEKIRRDKELIKQLKADVKQRNERVRVLEEENAEQLAIICGKSADAAEDDVNHCLVFTKKSFWESYFLSMISLQLDSNASMTKVHVGLKRVFEQYGADESLLSSLWSRTKCCDWTRYKLPVLNMLCLSLMFLSCVIGTENTLGWDETGRKGSIYQHIVAYVLMQHSDEVVALSIGYLLSVSKDTMGSVAIIIYAAKRLQKWMRWWLRYHHALLSRIYGVIDETSIFGRFGAVIADRASVNQCIFIELQSLFENLKKRLTCMRHDMNNALLKLNAYLRDQREFRAPHLVEFVALKAGKRKIKHIYCSVINLLSFLPRKFKKTSRYPHQRSDALLAMVRHDPHYSQSHGQSTNAEALVEQRLGALFYSRGQRKLNLARNAYPCIDLSEYIARLADYKKSGKTVFSEVSTTIFKTFFECPWIRTEMIIIGFFYWRVFYPLCIWMGTRNAKTLGASFQSIMTKIKSNFENRGHIVACMLGYESLFPDAANTAKITDGDATLFQGTTAAEQRLTDTRLSDSMTLFVVAKIYVQADGWTDDDGNDDPWLYRSDEMKPMTPRIMHSLVRFFESDREMRADRRKYVVEILRDWIPLNGDWSNDTVSNELRADIDEKAESDGESDGGSDGGSDDSLVLEDLVPTKGDANDAVGEGMVLWMFRSDELIEMTSTVLAKTCADLYVEVNEIYDCALRCEAYVDEYRQHGAIHWMLEQKHSGLIDKAMQIQEGGKVVISYLENDASWKDIADMDITSHLHADRVESGHGRASYLIGSKIGIKAQLLESLTMAQTNNTIPFLLQLRDNPKTYPLYRVIMEAMRNDDMSKRKKKAKRFEVETNAKKLEYTWSKMKPIKRKGKAKGNAKGNANGIA